MVYKTAIIGGGVAGLTAGIMLADVFGEDVIILEKLGRVGKKLIATGNGRGNVTNESLSEVNYHSKEGDAQTFVRHAIRTFDNTSLKSFLYSLGMLTVTEGFKVYPASLQASSVLDLMRARLAQSKATVRTDFEVASIKKEKCFKITSSGGEVVSAQTVILATGGKCQKQFGTDGSAYKLARSLGHTVTECLPSLVQLKTDLTDIRNLKGIKQVACLTLMDGNSPILCEKGDILFTEFGISGDATFRISTLATTVRQPQVSIEFMPELAEFELATELNKKLRRTPYLTAEDLLTGFVNKQVGRAIIKRAGINPTSNCTKEDVRRVAELVKDFRLQILGTLGFDYAQVTRGGVRIGEVDAKTMQSKSVEDLYFAGEILDIDGDCGGYNIQWATSSAYLAAANIIGKLGGKMSDYCAK